MEKADLKKPQIERRSPSAVMQLARMGSMPVSYTHLDAADE